MPFPAPPHAAGLNGVELIRELSAVFDLPQLPQSLVAPFVGGRKLTDYTFRDDDHLIDVLDGVFYNHLLLQLRGRKTTLS